MSKTPAIKCLLLDIGGVLLTDGWSHEAGKRTARAFGLDPEDLNIRHAQALDTYELGKLSMDEFLRLVVFHEKRAFTPAQFRNVMYAQSKAYPEMIALIRQIKVQYGLRVVVVSNEGRGLNEYRIRKFKLDEFVDSFVSSCYVSLRKPDADIFRVALDTAQMSADRVVFIDNTPMFVSVATSLGIHGLLHTDYPSTRAKLASIGLEIVG